MIDFSIWVEKASSKWNLLMDKLKNLVLLLETPLLEVDDRVNSKEYNFSFITRPKIKNLITPKAGINKKNC